LAQTGSFDVLRVKIGSAVWAVYMFFMDVKKNFFNKNIRVAAKIRVGRVTGTTGIFFGLSSSASGPNE